MSLIERAINKLQAERASPRAAYRDAGGIRVPVPSAVEAEAAEYAVELGLPAGETIALPRMKMLEEGLLPPDNQARLIADQYRRIKPPLIATAFAHASEQRIVNGRAIVVSSALPGEGKTFTSLNLAISLALEHELNVLLIDGDVAKRGLTMEMGLGNKPGLLDLIEEPERSLETCIYATDERGLYFMPSGERRATAPELLTSPRMRALLNGMLERFPSTFVIFDSPPILLTNEARALVSSAGQVLMVVRAGFSPRQSVLDALSAVGSDRPVSLLLNEYRNEKDLNYQYGYGEPAPAER